MGLISTLPKLRPKQPKLVLEHFKTFIEIFEVARYLWLFMWRLSTSRAGWTGVLIRHSYIDASSVSYLWNRNPPRLRFRRFCCWSQSRNGERQERDKRETKKRQKREEKDKKEKKKNVHLWWLSPPPLVRKNVSSNRLKLRRTHAAVFQGGGNVVFYEYDKSKSVCRDCKRSK